VTRFSRASSNEDTAGGVFEEDNDPSSESNGQAATPIWAARTIGEIPQNVNFALKSSVLRSFLDTKEISRSTAGVISPLPAPEIAEDSKGAIALCRSAIVRC